jgi:hypothetical protein
VVNSADIASTLDLSVVAVIGNVESAGPVEQQMLCSLVERPQT